MFDCHGGTLWLAGTKTEQSGTPYGVRDGGRLEAIGGYTNATEASENYMVEVDDASASVVTCQTFGGKWPKIVRETRGDDERTATSDQFPKRPRSCGCWAMTSTPRAAALLVERLFVSRKHRTLRRARRCPTRRTPWTFTGNPLQEAGP